MPRFKEFLVSTNHNETQVLEVLDIIVDAVFVKSLLCIVSLVGYWGILARDTPCSCVTYCNWLKI